MRIPSLIPAVGLVVLAVGVSSALAVTPRSTLSPALTRQAHRLYAPVRRFERSLTRRQKARLSTAAGRAGGQDQRLHQALPEAALEQPDQDRAEALPAVERRRKKKQLSNRVMNNFIHGLSAEMRLTLAYAPFNTCTFIHKLRAHHFSYAWASRSSDGKEAIGWLKQSIRDSERTDSFWDHAYSFDPSVPPKWLGLFTVKQLGVLSNLPAELG